MSTSKAKAKNGAERDVWQSAFLCSLKHPLKLYGSTDTPFFSINILVNFRDLQQFEKTHTV